MKLRRSKNTHFEKGLVEIDDEKLDMSLFLDKLYEGFLVDEPFNSSVSGILMNGLFYGTINSFKNGKYFIASSKSYMNEADSLGNFSETLLYNETKIDNVKFKRSVDGPKISYSLNQNKVNVIYQETKFDSESLKFLNKNMTIFCLAKN